MKISSKLNELKPTDLNCNVFDVYSYNGLSMQELLCQFFTKINECIKVSNETIDLTSWLVNEGLRIEVVNKLMLWLEDGTLEDLVNDSIIKGKVNKSCVKVHAINMSTTGDCLFIEFDNKQNMIVDCGKKESSSEIVNYIKNLGVEKIDYIFISHFDIDHYGGLETIIKSFNVDECKFIIPPTINYNRFLTDGSTARNNETIVRDLVAGRNVITPTENMELVIDNDTKLKFNNCSPSLYENYYDVVGEWTNGNTDYNNFSVVMTLYHMNNKMLFTGDINQKAQETLLPILEKCDLLKCQHHAVDTFVHTPYLKKVSPSIALAQCSGDNSIYTSQTSVYMWSNNIPYYTTFKSGDIVVNSDGFKINVEAIRTFTNNYSFKDFAKAIGVDNFHYFGFNQIKKKLYTSEVTISELIKAMEDGTNGSFNFSYGYNSCPDFISSWGGGVIINKYTSSRASLIAFDGNPSKFNVHIGLWHINNSDVQWYKLTDFNEFKNKCNAQTYTTYSQMTELGITTNSTALDFALSMPINSTYNGFVNSLFYNQLSSWGGMVSITKSSNNKTARIDLIDANPSIMTSWVGIYHEDYGNEIVWKEK